MAVDIINASSLIGLPGDAIQTIGKIGLWLQAIGIIIIAWIIFNIIALLYNMWRMREIHKIKEDMTRIEDKIDKIMKNI